MLNTAQLSSSADSAKLDNLRKVQEIIVNREPDLLDNFLDEVLAFQTDRSQDVRKFVVGFIEDACKKDTELLPKVIANLQLMLGDQAVAVQKRVIQAMTHLYRATLRYLAEAKVVGERMEAAWGLMCNIKEIIVELVESDNDGIRTMTVKFMETVVLLQTRREPESVAKENDFCLDSIPLGLKLVRPRRLEEEAVRIFDMLVKYHGSAHISSANLMTCMGSLTNIAKLRPFFMAKVITALEMLQANLPPTLAKSQVSSVRKHLKNQLLALLRHPTAAEHFFSNMTTLLTDLGAGRDEVMRAMPQYEEMKRKAKRKEREALAKAKEVEESTAPKRPKIDIPDEEASDDEDAADETKSVKTPIEESAVDITEKWVQSRLTDPRFATDLVLASMPLLPTVMPPHFNNTYTPIAAAGTEGQVRHVSRLLATQLTAAGLGPGVKKEKEMRERGGSVNREREEEEEPARGISTVVGMTTVGEEGEERKEKVKLMPAGLTGKKRNARTLKLTEVTKPISESGKKAMILSALQRILKAEKAAVAGGVPDVRNKIITTLAATFSMDVRGTLLDFIFADLISRADLAFSWLFEEYCFYQNFRNVSGLLNRKPGDDSSYNDILCSLIKGVSEKSEVSLSAMFALYGCDKLLHSCQVGQHDRELIMRRLYLESPIITDDAIILLKEFCQTGTGALAGVNLMKDLVMKRPTKQLNFLNSILEFCSHEDLDVRNTALGTVTQLFDRGEYDNIIEEYSVMYLRYGAVNLFSYLKLYSFNLCRFLLLARPPDMLFGEDRGRPHPVATWTEEMIRVCLHLYLTILPR